MIADIATYSDLDLDVMAAMPICRVRYCSVRAMTSSTGARRCEACSNRRSIKPSNPSVSYLNKYRRKLRSHIPNIRAASNCVSRPAFQPSYVSSNLILRFSCSTSVRLIWHPLRGTMTTGQMSRYRTGQIMNSQHPCMYVLQSIAPDDIVMS